MFTISACRFANGVGTMKFSFREPKKKLLELGSWTGEGYALYEMHVNIFFFVVAAVATKIPIYLTVSVSEPKLRAKEIESTTSEIR